MTIYEVKKKKQIIEELESSNDCTVTSENKILMKKLELMLAQASLDTVDYKLSRLFLYGGILMTLTTTVLVLVAKGAIGSLSLILFNKIAFITLFFILFRLFSVSSSIHFKRLRALAITSEYSYDEWRQDLKYSRFELKVVQVLLVLLLVVYAQMISIYLALGVFAVVFYLVNTVRRSLKQNHKYRIFNYYSCLSFKKLLHHNDFNEKEMNNFLKFMVKQV